jgi:hypothetical protein
MKILRIVWIVAIILLLPLMGAGFFTHSHQQKEKVNLDNSIKTTEKKIKQLEAEDALFEKLKAKGKVALEQLYVTKDNWWYLGELEGIKKKYKPIFRNISPSKVKQDKNFVTYSRLVNISSSFPDSVDLIDNLENDSDFHIEGLDIKTGQEGEDVNKHNVEFWMSFSRVKEEVVNKLATALTGKDSKKIDKKYYEKSLRIKPFWKKNQLLAVKEVKKDPFIDLHRRREQWLAKLKEEQEAKEKALLARRAAEAAGIVGGPDILTDADLSDRLVLKGILDIKGIKMAIFDAKYEVVPGRKNLYRYNVKVGDSVGDKEIVSIDKKRVILKSGDMTYYSMMP